ncbi:MAG: hypothetical protein Q4D87_03585 [Actinomycetaceae bacterium]|nr:hypothetical protein [Actinomycetaceae bacterium]
MTQVQPTPVTTQRVKRMLDDLELQYGVTQNNNFILPYYTHVALLSRGPDKEAPVWSVQSHWARKLDISYMSEAKNELQRQAATEFAPKLILGVSDDGMIEFLTFWSFNWTPLATDEQMSEEFRFVMNSLSRTYRTLDEAFLDPWSQEGHEIQ